MPKLLQNSLVWFALTLVVGTVIATVSALEFVKSSYQETMEKEVTQVVDEKLGKYEERIKDIIHEFVTTLEKQKYPVGTVIASYLSPKAFLAKYGEDWRFANGDGMDTNWQIYKIESEYYVAHPDRAKLPDLRGRFLRGLDEKEVRIDPQTGNETEEFLSERDPDRASRYPGHPQEDAFERHSHDHYVTHHGHPNHWSNSHLMSSSTDSDTFAAGSASETRPKNIGVYFYIKVN